MDYIELTYKKPRRRRKKPDNNDVNASWTQLFVCLLLAIVIVPIVLVCRWLRIDL